MLINIVEKSDKIHQLHQNPCLGVHFSQFGEDILLWNYFHQKRNGFYVDVGCHDPYRYSNTCLLHNALDWTGVNIDADPRAIAKFQAARPNDININIGVGLKSEIKSFNLFQDGAVNTFDEETAAHQSNQFEFDRKIDLEVKPLRVILSQALKQNQKIDYLNVDCEGLDYDVLTSNDWDQYRPLLVSVEVHGMNLAEPTKNPVYQLMSANGYMMKSHYVTTIFERIGL